MTVVETVDQLRQAVRIARQQGRTVHFVPTMGALHDGHASLIRTAAASGGFVVVSIFVNPTQFAPHEDFDRYPRTFDSDRRTCEAAGAELIYFPSSTEMYPPGFATVVSLPSLSETLEGEIRPGHFAGVATVVLKLLNMVLPDVAYFGAKDFQQQWLIRRMVSDLNLTTQITTCETVREADGLAMSSRNRYLSPEERQQAVALSQALWAARESLLQGNRSLDAVREGMREVLRQAGLTVDYAALRSRETFRELQTPEPEMVLLVAARLGNVRLIDNVWVDLPQ